MKKKTDKKPDDDDFIWTKRNSDRALSFDQLPAKLKKALRGRPKLEQVKEPLSLRLSPEVVSAFRASGAGWQTRIDGALKDWLKSNTPG